MADASEQGQRVGTAERLILGGATAVIILFVIAPILFVPIVSFTSVETLQFPPPGLSLKWYAQVLDMLRSGDDDTTRLLGAFLTSLAIAGLAVLLCVAAGVPAALALSRDELRGSALLDLLLTVPIVFPTIALAVAMLLIVSALGVDFGIWQIVVAHSVIALPFMVRNCMAALGASDRSLTEAAATLGAPAWRAFLEITLPLMKGGIASGALLVFVISFNEFTLTYFLYTIDVFPLSMWLFQKSNTSLSPLIFAVSTLVILVNVVAIALLDKAVGARGSAF